ncbi:MAG: hypothetical protein AB2689_06390 [Candidatus Thiodiazotropha taylori]
MKHPYSKDFRLADVMALIQVLALHKHAHRSEEGLIDEMQGAPKSAKSWAILAQEHPEFFRVKESGENRISLFARHVQPRNSDDLREPIPADFAGKLLQAAIELHDRAMERKNHWKVYIPIVVAVTAGIFTIIGIFLKTWLSTESGT